MSTCWKSWLVISNHDNGLITWYNTIVNDAPQGTGGGEKDDYDEEDIVSDEAIAKVMALGFDHHQAVKAIIKAKGDVGVASMMLSCDQVINVMLS